jgi:hypothetical protein
MIIIYLAMALLTAVPATYFCFVFRTMTDRINDWPYTFSGIDLLVGASLGLLWPFVWAVLITSTLIKD